MDRLTCALAVCLLFGLGCGDSGGSHSPDAASVLSSCGHPGDQGNSLGVGKFCMKLTDCTGQTNICSSLGNGSTPSPNDTYFCTIYPCQQDAGSQCGDRATCVCGNAQMGGGGCACTPNSCLGSSDASTGSR